MRFEPGPSFPWGIVARKSVPKGGTEESTQDQELMVEEHLRAHDMGRIVRKYTEVKSAFQDGVKRVKYEDALTDLRVGIIGGLAVYRWDRLARRAMEMPRIVELLRACGGRLLILDSDYGIIDTGDESKELQSSAFLKILHEMAQQAEGESAATSARITRWHIRRASHGHHHRGGVRAYGHTDDMLGLVQTEVDLLREASKRVRAGEPIARIVADWKGRNILTGQGKAWSPATLKRILVNPRMVGCREFGGQVFDMRTPVIFERSEWEMLCAKLEERSQHNGPRESHLCSNIAVCSVCTRPLITCHDGKGRAAYACKRRPVEPSACGSVWITRGFLDQQVTDKVIAFLSDSSRVRAVLDARTGDVDLAELHAERERLNASEAALVQRLNPPRGVPRLPGHLIDTELLKIAEERRELDMRQAVSTQSGLLIEALTFGESAARVWAERGIEYRRSILKLICTRIEVTPFRGTYAKGKGGGSQLDPERVRVTFADE
jgi:DNA invertase Pin-like site-specific DNA recombinase